MSQNNPLNGIDITGKLIFELNANGRKDFKTVRALPEGQNEVSFEGACKQLASAAKQAGDDLVAQRAALTEFNRVTARMRTIDKWISKGYTVSAAATGDDVASVQAEISPSNGGRGRPRGAKNKAATS